MAGLAPHTPQGLGDPVLAAHPEHAELLDHDTVREHALAFAQSQLELVNRSDAAAPYRDVVESVLAVAQALNQVTDASDAAVFTADAERAAFEEATEMRKQREAQHATAREIRPLGMKPDDEEM